MKKKTIFLILGVAVVLLVILASLFGGVVRIPSHDIRAHIRPHV